MGLYVSVCGPGDGFGQPDRHSPAGGGVVVHSRVEEDAQSVEVVYHSQSAGLRVRLPETQRRRQSNPPTLPNTGPTFARSLAIHIANPSPKRLCALPSTWACQHIHRADLRNAVHLEFPKDVLQRITLRIRHLAASARRDGTVEKRFARATHLELHVDLPVWNAQSIRDRQPSRSTRSVLRQANMLVGVLTSQPDFIAQKPRGETMITAAQSRKRRNSRSLRPPRNPT